MMMAYEEVVVIKMNVKHQLNNLLMTHDDSFVRSLSMDYIVIVHLSTFLCCFVDVFT